MEKKGFFIPQVPVEEEQVEKVVKTEETPTRQTKKREPNTFISSIYGREVEDNDYYPGIDESATGTRRYETLKENRTDYAEFEQYFINLHPDFKRKPRPKPQVEEVESTYQETIIGQEEVVEEIYDDEIMETTEYVSVKKTQIEEVEIPKPVETEVYEEEQQEQKYETEKVKIIVEQEPKPIKPIQKQGNTRVEIKPKKRTKYIVPPMDMLVCKPEGETTDDSETIRQRNSIDSTLKHFDIGGHVVAYTKGPTVTQFEVLLDEGVRNQKIIPIQSNLQGSLKATSIRMQIPIPGRATIGIEVPNVDRETVYFGDMIKNKKFLNDGNPLNVVLGVNINGDPVYLNIPKMPHGLIAGSTGSGKSVCINAIIASILYKAHPDDVKLVLIDPKRVEFARYSGIPHLASPIITEPKMANAALKWVVDEMENRYRLFEATGVTKYTEYLEEERTDARMKHIPYIVIIIDELADLMLTSGPEVEESIMRITQKARAAGIHLIVATQRPSVDIISGSIKTNIPTRIAFRVNKSIDSTIIIDHVGAEKLLGMGDMLYTDEAGVENRIQGAFISNSEIKQLVNSLDELVTSEFLFTEEDLRKKTTVDHSNDAFEDELFEDIARYVVENNVASINMLQKKFSCGFSRIQAIIIKLGELGVVSENLGSRAREVLVNMAELEEILNNI